jgi:hypothetical protein
MNEERLEQQANAPEAIVRIAGGESKHSSVNSEQNTKQ